MSNIYKSYDIDQVQNLLSQFLISNWSYSKVSAFTRNQKAFEMTYIFGIYPRKSATSVAGQAYHHALEYFFTTLKNTGNVLDLVELEQSAFTYIDEIPANYWKLSVTMPTVDDCIVKATKTVSALLRNFLGELDEYLADIQEILEVEYQVSAWLTINGVDIPMPCNMKIDLVVRTKSGKIAIVDHKSKSSFTDDKVIALGIGPQAITYALGYEEQTGQKVDEVWFIENKYSQNKNNSKQVVKSPIELDSNTRAIYESLLYESLKTMIEAVNNPDHIYTINQMDNLTDMAELYDFWARTMICEVDEFNVEESKRDLIAKRLKKVRDASIETIPPTVIRAFKENAASFIQYDLSNKNMTNSQKIEHVLRSFGTIVNVAHELSGYSSNTFLLEFSAGVKIASIYSKRLDIANALNVANVRISNELIPYQGKSYLGVEYAKNREEDLLFDPAELNGFKIPLGKDNFRNTVHWNLENHSTPHMLVCGATGSGKSVFITSIIEYAKLAQIDQIVIFDPKYEFTKYHDQVTIFVYNEIEEIEEQMCNLVLEMESLVRNRQHKKSLIIFDEYADAVDNSRKGNDLNVYDNVVIGEYKDGRPKTKREVVKELKSLEENLKLLAQKGRSSGFRIVIAMQRASVKVITGDIKVNFPIQVCFKVPKEVDSKVVIDEGGAESLAGYGDGLIKSPEYGNKIIRFQAFYKPDGTATKRVATNQDMYLEIEE
ncbi:MAG: DUF87 domain-containing protein [Chitinophagaceae bacterium]|nr:DUF87 domain-containing protein [Chitinophagaceae bacterium]